MKLMKDAYDKIFLDDPRGLFQRARYMLMLEKMKDKAIELSDDLRNTEYPFLETGQLFPGIASAKSDTLVAAFEAEIAIAQREFRESLEDVILRSRNLQKKYLGDVLEINSKALCVATRHVVSISDYYTEETKDEAILEAIIFALYLNGVCWSPYTGILKEEEEDESGSSDSDCLTNGKVIYFKAGQ